MSHSSDESLLIALHHHTCCSLSRCSVSRCRRREKKSDHDNCTHFIYSLTSKMERMKELTNECNYSPSLLQAHQLIEFMKHSVSVMRSIFDKVHPPVTYPTTRRTHYSSRRVRSGKKVHSIRESKYQRHSSVNSHASQVTRHRTDDAHSAVAGSSCSYSQTPRGTGHVITDSLNQYNRCNPINCQLFLYQHASGGEISNENETTMNDQYHMIAESSVPSDQLDTHPDEDEYLSVDNLLPSITSEVFTPAHQMPSDTHEQEKYLQTCQYICLWIVSIEYLSFLLHLNGRLLCASNVLHLMLACSFWLDCWQVCMIG